MNEVQIFLPFLVAVMREKDAIGKSFTFDTNSIYTLRGHISLSALISLTVCLTLNANKIDELAKHDVRNIEIERQRSGQRKKHEIANATQYKMTTIKSLHVMYTHDTHSQYHAHAHPPLYIQMHR